MPVSGNLLLAFKLKKTSKIDVKSPISKYVTKIYGANSAEDAMDELDTIQQLRNTIASGSSYPWNLMLNDFHEAYMLHGSANSLPIAKKLTLRNPYYEFTIVREYCCKNNL